MRSRLPLVFVVLLFFRLASAQAPPPQTTMGPANAPVTIAFYADFACPYSAETFFALEQLHERMPGNVRILFHHAPQPVHPEADAAHRAAIAAGLQGQFFPMAELIFANQRLLTDAEFASYAARLHLNVARFQHDMRSPEVAATLAHDVDEVHALGVVETPVLFLNGKQLTGTQALPTLTSWVQKASAHTQAPPLEAAGNALSPQVRQTLIDSPSAARGQRNSALTIVEFTDFQCPFCRAAAGPLIEFVTAHPGEVQLIYRSFPLDFHSNAEPAAEAALAAGAQGKFWEMHDLLFARQTALRQDDLVSYAAQLNLNVARFQQALSDHQFAASIASDRVLGERIGVDGTPTFVVDGRTFTGARSRAEWEQLLAMHLAAPPAAPSLAVAADPQPSADPGRSTDRVVLGPAKAANRLLWFTDVRSPLALQQKEALQQLPSTGAGNWDLVVKVLPLNGRTDSTLAAQALLAACEMGKFWPMYQALAEHRGPLDRGAVLAIASGLQLPARQFERELDLSAERVAKDVDEARQRGVLGTPTVLLGTHRVDGLKPTSAYAALLKSSPTPPTP